MAASAGRMSVGNVDEPLSFTVGISTSPQGAAASRGDFSMVTESSHPGSAVLADAVQWTQPHARTRFRKRALAEMERYDSGSYGGGVQQKRRRLGDSGRAPPRDKERPIPKELLGAQVAMLEDPYIRTAIKELTELTFDGGIDVKLGSVMGFPDYGEDSERRLLDQLERALRWRLVHGFIPFHVQRFRYDYPRTREAIQRAENPAEGLLSTDAYRRQDDNDHETETSPDHGAANDYYWGDSDEEEDEFVDLHRDHVYLDDLHFLVPSLGTGTFNVFLDLTDYRRKVVFKPSWASAKERGELDTVDADDPDAPDPENQDWFVYVEEEPDVHGKTRSPVSALRTRFYQLHSLRDDARVASHLPQALPPHNRRRLRQVRRVYLEFLPRGYSPTTPALANFFRTGREGSKSQRFFQNGVIAMHSPGEPFQNIVCGNCSPPSLLPYIKPLNHHC